MAGPSKSIDVSIKQLLNGSVLRTGDDLSISMHLSGDTETVLLKDYFVNSLDIHTFDSVKDYCKILLYILYRHGGTFCWQITIDPQTEKKCGQA